MGGGDPPSFKEEVVYAMRKVVAHVKATSLRSPPSSTASALYDILCALVGVLGVALLVHIGAPFVYGKLGQGEEL